MSSHSRGDPAVLIIGRPKRNLEHACLELSCRFAGFELLHCVDTTAAEEVARALTLAGRDLILVIVPAEQAAGRDENFSAQVQTLASRHGAAVAITEITPGNAATIPPAFNAGQPVRSSHASPDSKLQVVAPEAHATGYELRAIPFSLGPGTHSQIEPAAETNTKVVAVITNTAGSAKPVLLCIPGNHPIYLLARLGEESAPPGPGEDSRRHVPFGLLAPWFLLLRETGGRRSWMAPVACANLTIDDPRLVEPYGCLSFPGLLAEMQRERFHATIGFVPWNYDRNATQVVELFRAHPDRLSLAVHGNNHEGYEFFRYEKKPGDSQRSAPFAKQVFNIHQGLARIRLFEKESGLQVDRVMVFPQAISPAPTLEILRQEGFWATANFSNVPLDASVPPAPASALRSALTDWHDLPALRRDYPHEYSDEAIAIDLFLGNPVLFMAHQDDFSDGIQAFTAHAERVNRRQPAVKWVSLGEIACHLHRIRWVKDGTCEVHMVSACARITNPSQTPTRFRVALPRVAVSGGTRVTVDGSAAEWMHRDGEIRLELSLPAGGSALVEVHEPKSQTTAVPTARSGFRKRYLRMIADFRDLVVARSSLGRGLSKWYYRRLRRPALKIGRGKRRIVLLWDRSPGSPRLCTALQADLPPELR